MEKIESEIRIRGENFNFHDPIIMAEKNSLVKYSLMMMAFMLMTFPFSVGGTIVIGFIFSVLFEELLGHDYFILSFSLSFSLVCISYLILFLLSDSEDGLEKYSESYIISEDDVIKTTGTMFHHEVEKQFSSDELEDVVFKDDTITLFFEGGSLEFDVPRDMGVSGLQDEMYNL